MGVSGFDLSAAERTRYVFLVDDARNASPEESEKDREIAKLRKENARLMREIHQLRSRK